MVGAIVGGLASLGGGIYGAKLQADAMRDSARQQRIGQERAMQEQRDAYGEIAPMYEPYRQAGLEGLAGMGGDFSTQMGEFNYDKDVSDFLDPSMAYQQDQMRRNMEQSAVANSELHSGGFAKALQDRGAQVAQMDYGNAYNRMTNDKATTYQQFMDRFQNKRANNQLRLTQLQNMSTIGQNAVSGLSNARTGNANQVSANLQNIGTAQGYGAQANGMVYGQALQNLTSPQNLMGAYNAYNQLEDN